MRDEAGVIIRIVICAAAGYDRLDLFALCGAESFELFDGIDPITIAVENVGEVIFTPFVVYSYDRVVVHAVFVAESGIQCHLDLYAVGVAYGCIDSCARLRSRLTGGFGRGIVAGGYADGNDEK